MSVVKESVRFLGLRTALYAAPDLDRAKAWYTEVVGNPPYFDAPFYVGFNVGGYELGLDPSAAPAATEAPGVTVYWGVGLSEGRELQRTGALRDASRAPGAPWRILQPLQARPKEAGRLAGVAG